MSFIVPLIVTVAAIVALGGIVINTLLAVNGIAHVGKTLAQANRSAESRWEDTPRPERRSRQTFTQPEPDPIFEDDQALERLNQYFDHA